MTPELRIRADGADITDVVRDRLVSLSVTDAVAEESDTCELTLDDRAPGIALPPTGAVLEVELGYAGRGLALMGRYTVSEIAQEGPPDTLTLRGAAADMLGSLKAPRTQSWDFPTIGEIVGEIAARHDLVPQVEPILRDVVLPHVDQVAESDIGLLRRLADRQLDVVAKPANGRLLFVRRQVLASAEGSPSAPAVRISRTDTVDHRVLRADRDDYAAVTAQWHDVASAEPQAVRVGEPEGGPVFELPELFPDVASARNAASTKLRRLQRGSGTGEVTLALGRPELAADVPLLLEGWGVSGDGSWIATRVEHTFTPTEGLRTRVEIEAVTTPWNRASSAPPPEAPFGRPDVPATGARMETTVVDFSEAPPVDQIDPATIRWLHTDVSAWPIASQVLRVSVGERDVCIDHTAAGSWPTSALGSILVEGNAWIFAQVDGVWYGATWEWLRPGQTCKAVSDSEFGADQIQIAPLDATWQPQSGDRIGFAVSTRARHGITPDTGFERSNIVAITWP